MMEITTSSSIRVKPRFSWFLIGRLRNGGRDRWKSGDRARDPTAGTSVDVKG